MCPATTDVLTLHGAWNYHRSLNPVWSMHVWRLNVDVQCCPLHVHYLYSTYLWVKVSAKRRHVFVNTLFHSNNGWWDRLFLAGEKSNSRAHRYLLSWMNSQGETCFFIVLSRLYAVGWLTIAQSWFHALTENHSTLHMNNLYSVSKGMPKNLFHSI